MYYRNSLTGWTLGNYSQDIDPGFYDTLTGLTAVPSTGWTIQTIFHYAPLDSYDYDVDIQYGQKVYSSLSEAKSSITDPISINDFLINDTFRGWLIVKGDATQLNDPNQAEFISAGKLGLVSSAAGGGVGGEVNTASNIGSNGIGLFYNKLGVDLRFKNIKAGSSKITVTDSISDNTVSIDISGLTHAQLDDLNWANSGHVGNVSTLAGFDGSGVATYYSIGTGSSGTSGTSGSSGSSGTDGTSGSSGTNGTSGTSGTDGTSGSSGTNGTSGSSGTSGTNGTSGSSGSSGTNGTSGSSGTNGTSGSSGTNGTSGSSGTSGTNGTSGSSGTNGTNGTSGSSGTSGTNGTSGSSGTSGTNGTSGSSGTSGIGISGTDGTSGSSGTSGIASPGSTQSDFLIWSGGTWVSAPGIIGTPSDGTYTDGFFDTWVDSTKISNAMDDISEILKKLAPAKPPELSTKTIVLSSSYSSATLNRASDGAAVSYLLVSDLTTTDVQLSDMTIVSTGGGFNKSIGSNLTGFIDNVSVGSINYPNGNMNTGTTTNGSLTAIEYDYWGGVVGKSDFWPAVVARINDIFNGKWYGSHTSKISWSGATELQTTNLLTVYYDNPVTPSGNTLNLSTAVAGDRWISGVPTLSTNDALAVNYGMTGLVSQIYRPNPISASSSYATTVTNTLSGAQVSGTTISGTINPLVQTSKYVENILVTVTATNGKGTVTTYSNINIASSQVGKTMRVDTVSSESTRKLSGGIAGNFPVTYGGVYSSGSTLLSGDYLYELQMLNGSYRRISGNYTTNYPVAGPNYSSDSNTDYRWLLLSYSITSKSSLTVTVNGTNFSTNAGTQVTSNLKIFSKVEGSTGWLDTNNPYPGVGTPILDGDYGMVTASSTSSSTVLSKYLTFGAGNYSGTFYVRIGIASGSTITISTITVA